MLRRLGDLTRGRAAGRAAPADFLLDDLEADRRAIAIRVGGEERWIAAEDAGLYRDALGVVPPRRRCRRRSSRTCRTRASGSCAAGRGPTGPFETAALRARYGVDLVRGAARRWSAPASWCAASCGPAAPSASGATRRCCGGCGAPRWPPCARRSSPPTSARSAASTRAGRASTATRPPAPGVDRLREVLVPLQGLALPADVWERDVLPRRVGAYSPAWLDQLCASGEVVWVGAGSLGRNSGRVALYFREDAHFIGPPKPGVLGRGRDPRARCATASRAGACFFTDLLVDIAGVPAEEIQDGRLGSRLGGRGHQRRLGAAALAEARRRPASARGPTGVPGSTPASAARSRRCRAAGRSRSPCSAPTIRWPGGAPRPSCCSSATASSPASRCSPRASPAASPSCTTRSRRWRRSALAGAATSSRGSAARSSRCRARSSGCARSATTTRSARRSLPRRTRRSPTAGC